MAYVDNLIERIADPVLRAQIASEVSDLVERKNFGLVFQRHQPEDVEAVNVRPRRGDRARLRGDLTKQDFHVLSARAGSVVLLPLDAARQVIPGAPQQERSFDEVVVVKDFDYPIYPGLELVDRIDNGDDKPTHVVINGENYYALETLLYTHEGKVDIIYMDPPYNTGSDDWQYNDRYVESTDEYRHSKWLSFMERRLRHAQRLLKPSGVVFMSIDDNEQAHLRLLADQIFGADNFVDTLAVEMSNTSGMKVAHALKGSLVKNTEFIHIFRKSSEFDQVIHTPLFDGVDGWDYKYSSWLYDDGTIGSFTAELLQQENIRADAEWLGLITRGRIKATDVEKLLPASVATREFILANLRRIARFDRAPTSLAERGPTRGTYITVAQSGKSYILTRDAKDQTKQVFPLELNYRTSDDHVPRFGRTVIRGDFWKGFYRDMARVDQEGGVGFANGKKPVRLIKQLIKWSNNSPEAVILDFFGGSGTTTHAVMSLNAEDDGRRQSILITNNEVSKVTSNRLRSTGALPGDDVWEAEGVFQSVTMPRINNAIRGSNNEDASNGAPLNENVAFYRLTYEDENQVALNRRFEAIAPLLWLKAGASGQVVHRPDGLWALPNESVYGVLFDVAAAHEFAEAVTKREKDLQHVFVVADSESSYQAAISYLPTSMRISTTRLYADYLHSFEINGKG